MRRLPPWLPIALAVLAAVGVWAWWAQRDARLRAEGALAAETRQHRAALDSATHTAARADTVYRVATDTLRQRVTRYQTVRQLVPTFDAARYVRVDTAYVVAADSVVRGCTLLQTTCELRHRADSLRYAAFERLAADYRHAGQPARSLHVRPALFAGYGASGSGIGPQIGVGLALTWGH